MGAEKQKLLDVYKEMGITFIGATELMEKLCPA